MVSVNAEEGQIEGGARGRSGTRGGRRGCGWDVKERTGGGQKRESQEVFKCLLSHREPGNSAECLSSSFENP